MKTSLFLFVLLSCVRFTSLAQEIMTLNNWKFRQAGAINWYDAKIPGCIHLDLLNNGLIKDPFYRLNENDLQWIDKVNWEYKVSFPYDGKIEDNERITLVIEGLDTYADVFLNNQLIHSNSNMFVTNRIPIERSLLTTNNELRIYFKSPIYEGLKKLEEYGLALPADNDQSENGGLGANKVSVFTRKAPYHYGWDWGPRLVTSGIWKDIYFEISTNPVIKDLYIRQLSVTKETAELKADFFLSDLNEEELHLDVLINDKIVIENASLQTFTVPAEKSKVNDPIYVKQAKLLTVFSIPIKIDKPSLWWPNGHGEQNLYSFRIELKHKGKVINSKQVITGLRDIRLVRKPDEHGESFYFTVNGKPIFSKGANYIPSDVFLPRVTDKKYEEIIVSAANSNINMLRVWGGGIYENDIFYSLCDKHGIMIWQDFMFACAMYPGNKEFLDEVTEEVSQNIKRLRNYACLALWCGNNEIEQAWAQYDEKRGWGWKQRYNDEQRKIIWNAYDTIFHKIIPKLVDDYNKETDYWHSSPSAGMGKLANHENKSGDMHYWGVWHGNEPINMFEKYKARFMSEYGFQSFPEFESVKNYTSDEDWHFDSPVMLSHQRSSIGNQRIMSYMKDSYKVPNNFEDQIYVGQLLQAEAIKKAIKFHRSAMPYCMGSLYWQLNDCWPVASWSGIDYYGRWKALQYFVKESFKNQIVTVDLEDDVINITGVSDIEQTDASLRVNLLDFNGNSLWNRSYAVKMPSNSSKILASIPLDKIPAIQNKTNALLLASIVRNEKVIDREIFYLDNPKNLKLPNPELNIHIRQSSGNYIIEITSKKLCKNLMLISQGNAFVFSDNFFDILPGETKIVTVVSDLTYGEFEEKLSYIHLQQVE